MKVQTIEKDGVLDWDCRLICR